MPNDISLVVLAHGLWGKKEHMSYIQTQIQQKYGDSIYILNSSINEGKFTYDGIDFCGRRLSEEIESTVVRLGKNGKRVTRFSIIGYSLGGLISRYTIGLLALRGFFKEIEPNYYISFATPHMGVRLPSNSIVPAIFNYLTGTLVSRSGEQLQLISNSSEHKSMIENLSDPDQIYFKILSKFRVRRSYINTANDRTVPYWSAGMVTMDYFDDHEGRIDISLDEKYSSIVTGYDLKFQKKKKPLLPIITRWAVNMLLIILSPIYLSIVFVLISTQGIISRFRIAGLSSQTNYDKYVDFSHLAGVLDAINLPSDTSPFLERSNSDHTLKDHQKIGPGKCLEEKANLLPLDKKTLNIHKNINLLEWEKVWVYIQAFNSHGAIICRAKRFTTDAGEDVIKHFIDTTQL